MQAETESKYSTGTASGSEKIQKSSKSEDEDGKEDASNKSEDEESEKNASNFECNICLDTAKDAVISLCGHLFCWPCLHQWMETRAANKTCPVCKAAISKDKVIPLYGRGSSNKEDPRERLPPRPQGQRTEPEPQHGFIPGLNFGDGENFQFHFGIGTFPFGFFTMFNNFGFGGGAHGAGFNVPPELERELPRILQFGLLFLAFIFYWNLLFS